MPIQTGETNNLKPSGSPLTAPTVPPQPPVGAADVGAITPEVLSSQDAPLNIPPAPQQPDYVQTTKDLPTVPGTENVTTAAETQVTEFQKELLDLTKKISGKEGETVQAEIDAGVPEAQRALNEANAELKQHQVDSLRRQEEALQAGETLGFANTEAQKIARTDAIRGMEISIRAQTLQGNLDLARSQADRLVTLKYAPLEAEFKYLTTAYELNKDVLDREDKERAEQLKIRLDERDRILSDEKDRAKRAYDLAIDVIKNNPGNQNAINSAKEVLGMDTSIEGYDQKVISLLGSYTKTEDSGVKLTSEDQRNLIGAGFGVQEIQQIQSDINAYGIDAVLAGIDDQAQRAAIEKVYGVQQKVSREDVEAQITQKMASDGLQATFTEDELKTFVKDAGFRSLFKSRASELDNFLNSDAARQKYIDYLYDRYKAAGLAK